METRKLLETAKQAAIEAYNFLKKNRDYQKVLKNLDRDVKIKGDKESEKLIIDFLNKKTNFSIITEESGFLSNSNNKNIWIIDPIDGSLNYSKGIPFSAVSIGLWQDKKPILGVILDLNNKDMYSGIVGVGAWLNNLKINVSYKKSKSASIIATGFPIATNFSSNNLIRLVGLIKDYKKVRLFGAASISLAYYSCGKVDSYFEESIKLWDVAAGIAIAKGAGGLIEFSDYDEDYILNVNAKVNIKN